MNPRYNIVLPTVLQDKVLDFALSTGLEYFKQNTSGNSKPGTRRFCMLDKFPELELMQLVNNFKNFAYNEIGLSSILPEPCFGNFIGVNLEEGSVHQHTDNRDDNNNIHLRFNFMVQKPYIGGNPIIDGVEYQIDEGMCWINYASEWKHGSTTVGGNRPRVVLSMGACVPEHIVKEKISRKIGLE